MVAVDVGYGQLHERLRADARVQNVERTNVREARPGRPRCAVRSRRRRPVVHLAHQVLEPITGACAPGRADGRPREAPVRGGTDRSGQGHGVIADPDVWRRVLDEVISAWRGRGAVIMGCMVSPLLGAEGNVEFLLAARARPGRDRCRDLTPSMLEPRHSMRWSPPRWTGAADGLHRPGPAPRPPRAAELARELSDWLVAAGHDVRLPRDDAIAAGLPALGHPESDVVHGPRSRREPRRRRHDVAHGAPRGHRRRAGDRRQPRPARLPDRGRAERGADRPRPVPGRRLRHRGADARGGHGREPVGLVVPPGRDRPERDRAREDRERPHRAARRGDRRQLLHALRGRRADRRHADRFDRLLLVGPGPDRRARPTARCCSRRCRRTCCSTAPWSCSRTPSCASRSRAPAPPPCRSTVACSAS